MTLPNDMLAPAVPRGRRARLGLGLATIALGGILTACGGGPGGTTCGEFADMSDGEKRSLAEDLINDVDDGDTIKDGLDGLEGEEKDTYLDNFTSTIVVPACETGDDDTEIGDLIYEES